VDPHQTLDEVLGGAQHVAAAVTDAISTLQRHDAVVLQAANQLAAAAVTSDTENSDASAEALSSPTTTMTAAEAGSEVKMPSAAEVAHARELLAATMGPRLREALFRSDSSAASSFSSSSVVVDRTNAKNNEDAAISDSSTSEAAASNTASLLLTPQAATCMPLCPQGLAPEAFGVSVTSVRYAREREALDSIVFDDDGRAEALNAVFCNASSGNLNQLHDEVYLCNVYCCTFHDLSCSSCSSSCLRLFSSLANSYRVVVAARTPLQSLDDLVPTATSSNAAFAPQLTDAFHLGLFPDQSEGEVYLIVEEKRMGD